MLRQIWGRSCNRHTFATVSDRWGNEFDLARARMLQWSESLTAVGTTDVMFTYIDLGHHLTRSHLWMSKCLLDVVDRAEWYTAPQRFSTATGDGASWKHTPNQ